MCSDLECNLVLFCERKTREASHQDEVISAKGSPGASLLPERSETLVSFAHQQACAGTALWGAVEHATGSSGVAYSMQ